MRRFTAVLALTGILAATPACTMSRGARATFIATGAVSLVSGVVLMKSVSIEVDDQNVDDEIGAGLLGMLLVAIGVPLLVSGIAAQEPAPSAIPIAPPALVAGPPSMSTPVADVLPELIATDEVLRMAQQVRTAVLRHECDAAWRTVGELATRDATYAAVLGTSSVMSGCPRAD